MPYVFGYWVLDFTALVEDVQLCMVKLPPVCYKFSYFTAEIAALLLYVGMVKTYGEKKKVFLNFVLCHLRVEGFSLPGVRDYKQERAFCGMQQKKEGIELRNKRKVEDWLTIPILSINTVISFLSFYC